MKIALIENFGSDFYGARLRYALFLQNLGHEVIAIVPNDGYADKIKEAGITTIALDIDIRQRSLGAMLSFGFQLGKIFKREKFDIIHLYRMQPNIIGTPFAYWYGKKVKIVNHITGLGVAFTKDSSKFNLIKSIIKSLYNINNSIFRAQLIFQNEEDKKELGNHSSFQVIKGSAVNEDRFNTTIQPSAKLLEQLKKEYHLTEGKTLIFVSRLLKQKGLSYLIEAINQINQSESQKINLLIAGWIDPNNPDSFTETEIKHYGGQEGVIFLGKRNDINDIIALADIAVLPTYYREGTPRFLLEAMAMGKPILTTDMPGCNHLVKDNKNGVLVQPQSTEEILKGLQYLLKADLEKMGYESNKLYLEEFSEDVVYNQILNLYKK
ncbi:glycosyltransferase family 4 protein [Empedobacter sp. GD03861]|uniref:glycosyltransferase family 4 protein n=1 Tax=Empedobacter sp. GD03861 TaxID=2975390 RepID=UPI002449ED11|nr:glycosyltransferase family 4 protein [Empedobacter sp. GD03861]MDH0673402.1 glycosyltransferase family 4 protein [Empedobacter sp. GD03861]